MSSENLKIDHNDRNTLGAVTNDSDQFIKNIRVNPITGALIVEAHVTSTNTQIGSTIPGGTAGSVLFLDIGSTLGEDNSNFFYDPTNHFLGLGTDAPDSNLHIVGTFHYVDGNQTNGYVLVSDNQGNGTWQDLAANTTFITNLATDVTFTDTLVANTTFTTALAGDTNFTTTLAGDTNFTTVLAGGTNFVTNLAANTTFTTALSGLVAVATDGMTITGDGTTGNPLVATGSGVGTVTSVSVATANGVSGSVANPTSTPAITLTLGAITPSTVNALTLAAQTVGFTIAGGVTSKTLTVPLDASVSGTNTGDQTITLTTDVTGSGTGTIATTIANNAVTYVKMQAVSTTSKLLGSSSTTTPVQEITLGSGLSLSGTTLTASGGTPCYLNIKSPQDGLTTGQTMGYGCDMSQSSPTYHWFAFGDGGSNVFVYRLDKQTSGNYVYKGITATITTTSTNKCYGIVETGGVVYVWFADNGTSKLTRFTTALGSPTTITGFSTSLNAVNCMNSDVSTAGKIWVAQTNSTTVTPYTISGTVATAGSSVTLDSGLTNIPSLYKSSTDFFFMDNVGADTVPNLIQRYDATGTSGTDIVTALFTFDSNVCQGLSFVNLGGSIAYVVAQKFVGAALSWYLQIQTLDIS